MKRISIRLKNDTIQLR